MGLLEAANTPKALIGALVLFIVLDGLLFYRYQLEKSRVLTTLQSATAAPNLTTSRADSEGEQQDPQREENNQGSDASDNEQKDGSAQETTPEESSAPSSGNTGETSPPPPATQASSPTTTS